MDWKQNKTIFNYIGENDYSIIKDQDYTDILNIKWDKFDMKCKYFLAFTVNNKNEIIWSFDNPYIDQKTKYLSYQIKLNMKLPENELKIFSNEFITCLKKNIIQSRINIFLDNEQINFIWCLVGKFKKYKQFYIITDIVYI
jgi:hypothetical protein